jgi:diguanylate cyclase (GGDEF)-like protein
MFQGPLSPTDFLRRLPILRDLTDEELGHVAAAAVEQVFQPGEVVGAVGEAAEAMDLILEGSARVLYPARSEDFELARLGEGTYFGEMALLNERPRSATIQAVGNLRTLRITRIAFRRILTERPGMALKILETLSERIRNVDDQASGISEAAMRDPLTGLLNRKAFHERLEQEAERHRRYGDPYALILLDMDQFRMLNDAVGTPLGDRTLEWVGRLLSEHTRAADTPFRIGGEEFAILAPATDSSVARGIGERLVETISEARPPAEIQVAITCSAGWASAPTHGRGADAIYNAADQALLQAKAEGRNRVGNPDTPAPS